MSSPSAVPQSTIPLWGQAWKLDVTYATDGGSKVVTVGSSEWEPESLSVTFEVLQAMNTDPFWYADISIYNMTTQDAQNTYYNATWATLSAGFQVGPSKSTIIWDGPVFQTIFTRENVVDTKITLHCVANPLNMSDIVNFALGQGSSQAQIFGRMISDIDLPPALPVAGTTQQGTVSQLAYQRLSAKQYPRGRTTFGKVGKYLSQLADDNFMQSWRDGQKVYMSELSNPDTTPDLIYAPPFPPGYNNQSPQLPPGTTQSIVGTPQQIPQGAVFTVLLDPRLKVQLPPLVLQLVRTQLTAQQLTPSVNSQLPSVLGADLKFFAMQVKHVGDTRGNDWHTEVTACSTTYADNGLNGIFAANSQIGG
jgi:hypothetical protein